MLPIKSEFGGERDKTSISRLAPDCAKCCGLCCVGPSFEVDQGFGFSKPAHTPCRHLGSDFRCRIHHTLRYAGFPACAEFSCFGAGQRVTQRLFRGLSWKSSPEVASRMFNVYSRVRMLHESLALLEWASARVSSAALAMLVRRSRWIDQLCESADNLPTDVDVSRIRKDVLDLVRRAMKEPGR